jgi:hypothetical protein
VAKNYKITTANEKISTYRAYANLTKGITQGAQDLVKDGVIKNDKRFDNRDLGQRSPKAQEAMERYSFYKIEGTKALKEDRITLAQFNYLKGKAGSGTHLSHYVDDERFPGLNQTAFNASNFGYQLKQTLMDGQSVKKMVTDLYQQGRGANDKTPLLSAELEINNLKAQNKKP